MQATFTKTTDSIDFVNPEDLSVFLTIGFDQYEIGFDAPMETRQEATRADRLLSIYFNNQSHGLAAKPSKLVRGTADTQAGSSATARVGQFSETTITHNFEPLGFPSYRTDVGFQFTSPTAYDNSGGGVDILINCQFVRSATLPAATALTDAANVVGYLTACNVWSPPDLCRYNDNSDTGSSTRPPGRTGIYAVEVDGGSDVPDYYSETPTHLIVGHLMGDCYGENCGLAAAVEPRAGWAVIPNDQNNVNASRWFDGVEGCPCGSKLPSNSARANRLGWVAGNKLYLTSGHVGGYAFPNAAYKRSQLRIQYAPGMADYYQIDLSHGMDAHLDIPACRVVVHLKGPAVYSAYTFGTGGTWALKARCYPGNETVTLDSGDLIWDLSDMATIDAAVPVDMSLLPATCAAVYLYLEHTLDFSEPPEAVYRLVVMESRTPYNPEQTTAWPGVCPGYAREVSF